MSLMLESLVVALGWTLLHFVWQGLVIGLAHETALKIAATPQRRYVISLVSLGALLAAPLITFGTLWAPPASSPAITAAADAAANTVAVTAVADNAFRIEPWLPWLVGAWLTGVCLLAGRFAVGLVGLRRILANADHEGVPEAIRNMLDELAARMGIWRKVRVALSTRVSSPLVVGWFRPVVLLPLSAATGLDHQQLTMVLAHELAHLRRFDHLVNLVQVAAETLLFYHPAVHRVSRSLRQEREACCDDIAVLVAGNRVAYAHVLAQLEEMRQRGQAPALSLGIAEHELYARIHRLVAGDPSARQRDKSLLVMLAAVSGLVVVMPALDTSAPLLPDALRFGPDFAARQVIALPLPAMSERRVFTPIRAPAPASIGDEGNANAKRQIATSAIESLETAPATVSQSAVPTEAKSQYSLATKPAAATTDKTPERSSKPDAVSLTTATGSAVTGKTTTQPTQPSSGGELLHIEEPAYPRHALRRGIEGQVELAFTIGVDGRVSDVAVIEARPAGIFDRAATDAIRGWRYTPFTQNGEPMARRATQVLEFRLGPTGEPRDSGSRRDCRETTGTRLCRPEQTADVELRVINN